MPRPIDQPTVLVGLMMSMVAQSAFAGHPSLFVKADELAGVRDRARTTHARYLAAARLVFERDRKARPDLPNAPDNWDNWPIEPWAARMINASVLAAVSEDEAEAEQAVA